MTLQEIAKILINPFIILFLFLGVLLLKRKCHKGHVFFFTVFFYAISIPFPAKIIGRVWAVADTMQLDRKYDYAVVLSGMVKWDWYGKAEKKPKLQCVHMFGDSVDRIMTGLDFLQSGRVNQLLIGNAIYENQVREGEIVSDFLHHQGVALSQYLVYGPVPILWKKLAK